MSRVHEIKEKRVALRKEQEGVLSAADTNEGGFTSELQEKFDAIEADMVKFDEELDRIEAVNSTLAARDKQFAVSSSVTQDFYTSNKDLVTQAVEETEQIIDLFATVDFSDRVGDLSKVSGSTANKALRDEYRAFMMNGDQASLQHTKQGEGGYLVAPEQFIARLIQGVDDAVFIRQLATIITLTEARSIGVPTLESDVSDPVWTSEVETGDTDDSLGFGKRKMVPQPLAKEVKVSKDLLRINAINAEAIILKRLAYKFAVAEENGFMTGDGNDKALGLFVPNADGIPTSRDVSAQNLVNGLTAEGLINAKYTLKPQYMMSPSVRWLFHRDAIKGIRKLRYDNGNEEFVWKPGLKDAPDTILEIPYLMSEFVPNTFTASNYVGMLGDFSHYWIVEVMKLEIQRLNELYAKQNKVGFIGRTWLDGAPVLPEAFVRLQLAAS